MKVSQMCVLFDWILGFAIGFLIGLWDFNLYSRITTITFFRFHRIIGSKRKDFDVTKESEKTTTESEEISSFRRYLPQVIACSAKNLLIVDLGLAISFSTILISALSGLNPTLNPNETLSITPDESAWIASMAMIFQPIGAFLTGFIEPLGRKRSLILVNIPYAIAWIMLYFAQDMIMIYSAFALLGIGIGVMERYNSLCLFTEYFVIESILFILN